MAGSITPAELRDRYRSGGEIAIIDAREEAVFHERVRRCFKGDLKPPFNQEARSAAGFPARYYEPLVRSGPS